MSQLDSLLEAMNLKDVTRKGWELRGVDSPETVASHSWGVALLTMKFAEGTELDEARAIKMAVIHDLAEAKTGDRAIGEVYQEITDEERIRDEKDAWTEFEDLGNSQSWRELWEEFETESSPEAKFVADMDLLDMCLTAVQYEQQQRYDKSQRAEDYDNLDGFFVTADENIQTEIGRKVLTSIKERYQKAKQR